MVKLLKIFFSKLKNKKYDAFFKLDNDKTKKVSFGQKGANDYTITGDKEARKRYRARHNKDLKTNDPTRAGYLSYYILWGDSTDIKKNITDFRKRFNL